MLINLKEAFELQDNLVAFNFYNLETLSGILEAAEEENKIVIASFGESYIRQTPLAVAAAMAKAYASIVNVPVVLHLDHATEINVIKQAIDLGFTSVMYDGSKLSLEDNIKNTREVILYAKDRNVTVEGELGYLNKEDGSDEVEIICTSVEDAKKYTEKTGVDALAIAVGNAHGLYRSRPDINTTRIREIYQETHTPLVLHGSSGITKEVLKDVFAQGIRKINVNTELAIAGSAGAYKYISLQGQSARFENVMVHAKEEMKKVCKSFLGI